MTTENSDSFEIMRLPFMMRGVKESILENQKARRGFGLASNQRGYVFKIPQSWELWRAR